MSYQPTRAKKAAEAQDPNKVLTAENFPSLGGIAVAGTTHRLDFLKRVKESEEERRLREESLATLDPNGILGKSAAALEEMGWTLLSISREAAVEVSQRLSTESTIGISPLW